MVSLMDDSGRFREFEHSGWQSIPTEYHEAFGSLTSQAIGPLLDAVRIKKGVKLLDIASGPGYVAAMATRRGALVVGVDFSAAMVEKARQVHPGVEYREGDAEALPFGNGLFDAAVMNYGILHLSYPEKALLEAQRVLRSGGRFAFSVWANPEESIAFEIVLQAVTLYGEPRIDLPQGPPFFLFSDPEECERGLRLAGFEEPKIRKIAQVWRLPAEDGLFNAMKDSTVRTGGLLRAQKPTVLEKIRKAIREEVKKFQKEDFVEFPMAALIASAIKP